MLAANALGMSDQTSYFKESYFLENEFCIWMGYIESVRPIQKEDLEEGNLVIVYTGVLENIKFTGSNVAAANVELQFRDRMKWLMDSTVNLFQNEVPTLRPNNRIEMPRSTAIISLARRAIGHTAIPGNENSLGSSGATIVPGEIYDLAIATSANVDAASQIPFAQPNVFYGYPAYSSFLGPKVITPPPTTLPASTNALPNPQPAGVTTSSVKRSTSYPEAFFNIYTARRGVGKNSDQGNSQNIGDTTMFLINNQITIEAIKSLAMQEVFPTEVFQDHRSGDFYYSPRGNITEAYGKSQFNYRVYMYNPPSEIKSLAEGTFSHNNFLLAYREESSSIGLKTNFIVSNNSLMTGEIDPFSPANNGSNLHLKVSPPNITSKFASKFYTIQDPTIGGVYEAMAVAINIARLYARETNAGMTVMLGDPSIVPGEIIKVLGSPFYPYNGYTDANLKVYDSMTSIVNDGFTDILNYEQSWNNFITTMAKNAYSNPTDNTTKSMDMPNNNQFNLVNENIILGASGVNYDKEITDWVSTITDKESNEVKFNTMPRSMWRVEAVMHKFNLGVKGYTTELALVKPY
jgi:hypothetical protein